MQTIVDTLKTLRAASCFDALRKKILGLATAAGPVKSYMVSFDDKKRMVFCFLEMKSPLLDAEVRELDAVGFGSGLVIEFPVSPDFGGSTGTWTQ